MRDFGWQEKEERWSHPSPLRRETFSWFCEYWIGDPANKALEILTLKEGRYELHGCAEEKGKLTSLVLPGLEFDLTEIQ
jgi:Uma2 family endonuclease